MVKQYLSSLLFFTLIDGFWLVFVAPKFYRTHIGHLMKPQADLIAASLFYLLFLVGLNVFVISPKREEALHTVAAYGALFGLITYATFDLTSAAVFKDFSYLVAGIDMLWGAILCATISVLTLRFGRTRDQTSN
ncbi:MAG: hypothetical protein CMH49_09595 [Myxococcales bacterium]|nr:hypothetical protein [Myxococcales bacterium]